MCYSIFTTFFCCLPFGVAALIHSSAASRANQRGDRDTAERSARLARNLNHVAVGFGILTYITCITVIVLVFFIY
ncbi:hypothetical protein OJAV_G00157500 [Oryzias javanicus]|uniref:Uncharacterized protein n=1 Tax=Oryzias javanicus TaxID=123683 RepID=A0A3S2PBJ5_ORYJA|nr:hypothetical protein OJAV_G00157500 [Oryzias javanicus]